MNFGSRSDAHAGLRLVDQEQGRLVGVAVDIGVHDDVVGDVGGGDEPFLAGDDDSASPRRSARVRTSRGSEPASGSVTATQARGCRAQLGTR